MHAQYSPFGLRAEVSVPRARQLSEYNRKEAFAKAVRLLPGKA